MTAPGLPAMLMVPLGSGWLVKVMRLPAAVWLVFIVLCVWWCCVVVLFMFFVGECDSFPLTFVWCGRAILFRSTTSAHPVVVVVKEVVLPLFLLHAVRSQNCKARGGAFSIYTRGGAGAGRWVEEQQLLSTCPPATWS